MRALTRRWWALAPLTVFAALFYLYPLAVILRPDWSALARPSLLGVMGFTFGQAALSTLVTVLVGLPLAWLVARHRFPGQGALRALSAVPFILPTPVVAAAFNALLGANGWLNLLWVEATGQPPLRLTGTLGAIVLAHVFYNTTLVMRLVGDFWANLDPRLPQAAQLLGANPLQAWVRVTLPLLMPALGAAGVLVFIFNVTSFGVVLLLGGPRFATLEVAIYRAAVQNFDLPAASALALVQMGCTLALAWAYVRLNRATAQSVRPPTLTQKAVRGWRAPVALMLVMGALALLVLPLAALGTRSVFRLTADRGERAAVTAGFTLDYYQALSTNPRQSAFFASPITAFSNSLGLAALTTTLALALGVPAAWALAGRPHSRLLNALTLLPLGTSALTLGLGLLLAFAHPPLAWRTSPLMLAVAHTLMAVPFVIRTLLPAWQRLRPALRHAAQMLGAPPAQVFWRVELPLASRALVVSAALAFAVSLGEFGATALLTRPDFPTVPVMIAHFLGQPGALNYGQGLALSTLLMLVCAACVAAIETARVPGSEF